VKTIILIATLSLFYSCTTKAVKPTIDKIDFSQYLISTANNEATPKLKKFIDFNPETVSIVRVDGWRNKIKLNEEGKPFQISKKPLIDGFFNLISTYYNVRYCCCPVRDFKIVFKQNRGEELTFFADTISEGNEMLLFPANYNFCLKTDIKLLKALTSEVKIN